MGVISDHQIQQLQQLLPQAAQQQQQQPQAPAPMSFGGQQLNVPGLGGVFHQGFGQQQQQQQQLMGWGGPPSAPHGMQQRMPGGNSPLEEGERAETDEDIQVWSISILSLQLSIFCVKKKSYTH